MNKEYKMRLSVVVHEYGGCIEDVNVFAGEIDALRYLNAEIEGQHFNTIGEWAKWQTEQPDNKTYYSYYETSLNETLHK